MLGDGFRSGPLVSSHDGERSPTGGVVRGRGTRRRQSRLGNRTESALAGWHERANQIEWHERATQIHKYCEPPRSGQTATLRGSGPSPALPLKSDETRGVGLRRRRLEFFSREKPRRLRARVSRGTARTLRRPRRAGPPPPGSAKLGRRAARLPCGRQRSRLVAFSALRALRRVAAGSRASRWARRGSTGPRAPARYPSRECDRRAS
jgi:hypothetical protein